MSTERLTSLLAGLVSIDDSGAFEDLDSLRLIDLVERLESEYGIRIAAEHVTPQTFANVNALAELVLRLKKEGA